MYCFVWGEPRVQRTRRWRNRSLVFIASAILALISLRLINLEADTPAGISITGMGTYVDEGYKTLNPRNLAVFGSVRWHPEDDFSGWMEPRLEYSRHHWSPLTQWPYYLAFRLLGPRLSSARIATVVLSALLLLGYAYATAREYSTGLFFVGMILLGLHSTLFFYSRLALFVMPVVACVYWLLFLLRRFERSPPYFAPALILVFAVVSTFGVRASAPIYFAPIVLGFVAASWISRKEWTSREIWWLGLGSLVILGLLAVPTRSLWLGEHQVSAVPARTLLNPLLNGSALWVTAGLLCTLNRPSRIATLKPDYFLYCETTMNRRLLEHLDGVELESPIFVSSYIGRKVTLHRLRYEGDRRPPSPGATPDAKSRSVP